MTSWLIAIMGPTASGKTSLGVEIAKRLDTVVLSADSRQFYKEMKIGTARPDISELEGVPHLFLGNLSVQEEYTAGMFEKDALAALDKIYKEKNAALLVGGSTLYLSALMNGIDPIPAVSEAAREEVQALYEEHGLEGLQEAIQKRDPDFYHTADIQNPRRLMRALEVSISASAPFSSFLRNSHIPRPFQTIKIGIGLEREELYSRINMRCDAMLEAGLLEEVKSLYNYKHLKSLQTVGYREFFDFLDGKLNYEEAVLAFKQHTRNYAKRQLTWFRKEKDMKWFERTDIESIMAYLKERMERA